MNTALKQRLIGAIVLVALAVIFLPMLLDGGGTLDDAGEEIEIPDRPEVAEAEDAEELPDAVAPEAEADAEAPEAVAEEPTGVTEDTDAIGADDEGEAAAADDDPPGDADAPAAGAVQTASFSRRDYARAQRDQLREAGYDAFLDEAESNGTRIWRVRVGPVALERDAHEVRDELRAEQDLDAIVVSHP